MDDPAEWDRLIAAIEAAPAAPAGWVWAFLVLQGLVEESTGAEQEFLRLWKAAKEQPQSAGPGLGFRLAAALRYAGVTLPRAGEPDPYGREARSRAVIAWQWHRG